MIKVSEYQDYVKPVFNPELTKYCTDLTGITQFQVNKGKPFYDSFKDHYKWLIQNVKPEFRDLPAMENIFMVTCGNWDLMTMLPTDCKRHKIKYYPAVYRRFIDIKSIYKKTLKTSKKYGLANMMKNINMKMDGRHHSGIDDCRNTGKLFEYLVQKGYDVSPKDIVYVGGQGSQAWVPKKVAGRVIYGTYYALKDD